MAKKDVWAADATFLYSGREIFLEGGKVTKETRREFGEPSSKFVSDIRQRTRNSSSRLELWAGVGCRVLCQSQVQQVGEQHTAGLVRWVAWTNLAKDAAGEHTQLPSFVHPLPLRPARDKVLARLSPTSCAGGNFCSKEIN